MTNEDSHCEPPIDEIEQVFDRFEESWQTAHPPKIGDYVHTAAECEDVRQAAQRNELITELIKIDLEYRWRLLRDSDAKTPEPETSWDNSNARDVRESTEGDTLYTSKFGLNRRFVEDYLREFPEIEARQDLMLSLIEEEYRVRQRFGDAPSHESFRVRFSQYADALMYAFTRTDKALVIEQSKNWNVPDSEAAAGGCLTSERDNLPPGAELVDPSADATLNAASKTLAFSATSHKSGSETRTEYATFLADFKPFSDLPIEVTNAFAACMEPCEFEVGETLLAQGETTRRLIVVMDGVIEVNLLDEKSQQHVIDRSGAGSVLGEMGLLTNQPHSANVVAVTRTRGLVLNAEDFHRIAQQFPPLSVAFAHLIATRVGHSEVDVFYDKTIKGYRIKRRLGVGAMAVVYEAEELSSGRNVALKMMSHQLAYDHESVVRFHNEAEIVQNFFCKNIVQVYNCFSAYNTLFIAMELCDGPTLANVIDRCTPLPENEVRAILGQLANALAHAHSNGVIHRDLKPANIMLLKDGTVKLSDFGLAKSYLSADLTNIGQILGTPRYMPPEQLVGTEVDYRADIYALGCITYELLMGEPLFSGSDTMDLLRQQLALSVKKSIEISSPQDPGVCRLISPDLKRVLSDSLKKDAQDRVLDLEALGVWQHQVSRHVVASASESL